MPDHRHPRRVIPTLAALLLAGLLLAACGSSSSTGGSAAGTAPSGGSGTAASGGSGSAAAGTASRASFRACLKAHGVRLPPRRPGARPGGGAPGAGGSGGPGGPGFFFGGGGGGGAAFSRNPKAAAAFQACGGGRFRQRRQALTHATITRFVTCVRQHGYNMPAPNFSGNGPVFPAQIRSDPKFRAASRSCLQLLFPRPPGSPAPGTGPSA